MISNCVGGGKGIRKKKKIKPEGGVRGFWGGVLKKTVGGGEPITDTVNYEGGQKPNDDTITIVGRKSWPSDISKRQRGKTLNSSPRGSATKIWKGTLKMTHTGGNRQIVGGQKTAFPWGRLGGGRGKPVKKG